MIPSPAPAVTCRNLAFWATMAEALHLSMSRRLEPECLTTFNEPTSLLCTRLEFHVNGSATAIQTMAACSECVSDVASGGQLNSLHRAWEDLARDWLLGTLDHPLLASSSAMTQHPPLSCCVHLEDAPDGSGCGCRPDLRGACPLASPSAASASTTTTSSSPKASRARRRSEASKALAITAASHPMPADLANPCLAPYSCPNVNSYAGTATSGARAFLGALYDSFSLWELVSLVSAIAWLLVCVVA